jgi:type VI secretion system protein VasG
VGKTESVLALSEALFGGERNLVTINLSEYQEAHTVSLLKGSPPGYVGYGEGGILTEAVRRRPYSAILLDEAEKAHPDVLELFFQVFDKGMLEDGEGRQIDFKNTVILLTSNVGSEKVMGLCADTATRPDPEELRSLLRPDLRKKFPAAFLGRLSVVPYYPISADVLPSIVRLQLGRIAERLRANHKAELRFGDELVDWVARRSDEPESGARNIDYFLSGTLLPAISCGILERMARGERFSAVSVELDDLGGLRYNFT